MNKADGTAFLRRNGQQINLGGIAKGYAADEAVRILKKYKVHNALINFGGTVVVLGKEQKIGIQNPFQKSGVSMADIAEETSSLMIDLGSLVLAWTLNRRNVWFAAVAVIMACSNMCRHGGDSAAHLLAVHAGADALWAVWCLPFATAQRLGQESKESSGQVGSSGYPACCFYIWKFMKNRVIILTESFAG